MRIGKYVYAFCTICQRKVNYNVCSVIGLTCFGKFECVYTFCAIFPCKFNYNVCLVIKITGFGKFQNQYIVICILYQFLMWIQLWWWNKCIFRSAMSIKTWNWWIFWWQSIQLHWPDYADQHLIYTYCWPYFNSDLVWLNSGQWLCMVGISPIFYSFHLHMYVMYTPWYFCISLPYTLFQIYCMWM